MSIRHEYDIKVLNPLSKKTNKLIIDSTFIQYKGVQISTLEIEKFKCGGIKAVGGLSVSYEIIIKGNNKTLKIGITRGQKGIIGKEHVVVQQIQAVILNSHGKRIFEKCKHELKRVGKFKYASCIFTKESIKVPIKIPIWFLHLPIRINIPWNKVKFYTSNGELTIKKRKVTVLLGRFSYREQWDIHVLALLLKYYSQQY